MTTSCPDSSDSLELLLVRFLEGLETMLRRPLCTRGEKTRACTQDPNIMPDYKHESYMPG